MGRHTYPCRVPLGISSVRSLRLVLLLALPAVVLLLLGCFQPLVRPENLVATAVLPTPTLVPTTTPTPMLEPIPTATPEPIATLPPTPTPILIPTPTPESTPTPETTPDIPFFLDLQQPAFNSAVSRDSVTVLGFTKPGTLLEVNGSRAVADATGRFEKEVLLAYGINVIEIIASDGAGGQLREFRQVIYAPPTPASFSLLVTEPANLTIVADQPIRIAGRTRPGTLVTVNGVSVSVDEQGQFATLVQLQPGPNIIDIIARSTNGKILSSTISVNYSPQ